MREGITKQQLVEVLGQLLSLTREGIEGAVLADNDTVKVIYDNGYEKTVNIRMNSGLAIIRDVCKNL